MRENAAMFKTKSQNKLREKGSQGSFIDIHAGRLS